MAISAEYPTRATVRSRRDAVICIAIAVALAVNLIIYAIGTTAGASFTYTRSGKKITVDAVAIAVMSGVPLAGSLAFVALLSRRWPGLIKAAKVASPTLAVATIALMTIPADFDATSTLFLATMHLTLIPISVLALSALDPYKTAAKLMDAHPRRARH